MPTDDQPWPDMEALIAMFPDHSSAQLARAWADADGTDDDAKVAAAMDLIFAISAQAEEDEAGEDEDEDEDEGEEKVGQGKGVAPPPRPAPPQERAPSPPRASGSGPGVRAAVAAASSSSKKDKKKALRKPRRSSKIKSGDVIILLSSDEDDDPLPIAGPSKPRPPPFAKAKAPLTDRSSASKPPPSSPPSFAGHAPPLPPDPARAACLPVAPEPEEKKEAEPALSARETALNHILTLLDDIDPAHAEKTVDHLILSGKNPDELVSLAMEQFFGDAKGYPKLLKRKRGDDDEAEDESPSKKSKGKEKAVSFESTDRPGGGEHYHPLCMTSFQEDFPLIPIDHIRRTFFDCHSLYVPAYLLLLEHTSRAVKPYKEKTIKSRAKGKSRLGSDEAFEAERAWIEEKLAREAEVAAEKARDERLQQEAEDTGVGFECGCCYSLFPFEKAVQCGDAHLFCGECLGSFAAVQIGDQKTDIVCMAESGCKAAFPESELRRILDDKLLALLQRLLQEKQISAAGIDGLSGCPFCSFSIIIENENEKLLRCQNEDCMEVSCRSCKRKEHLPKSCEEAAKDHGLDARHHIEEEMTKALIRRCPNTACGKPTLKESGCNKMTCSNCSTLFCYVCTAIIKDYSHFDQNPASYHEPKDKKKCPLWEDMNARHENDVREARERAKAEMLARGEEVNAADLEVALPDAPPAPPPGAAIPGLHRGYEAQRAAQQAQMLQFQAAGGALQAQAAHAQALHAFAARGAPPAGHYLYPAGGYPGALAPLPNYYNPIPAVPRPPPRPVPPPAPRKAKKARR